MKLITTPFTFLITLSLFAQPSSGRIAWWTTDGNLNDSYGHNGTAVDLSYTTDRNEEPYKALLIGGESYAGIDLGEMNAILLRKIEELTLHVLALEQKLSQQTWTRNP